MQRGGDQMEAQEPTFCPCWAINSTQLSLSVDGQLVLEDKENNYKYKYKT